MEYALGIIEIRGLATAITVADTMAKTAAVNILDLERTNGGGWTVIKISGNVAAVNASINAGKQVGASFGGYVSSKIIPRPAVSVKKMFCESAAAAGSAATSDTAACGAPAADDTAPAAADTAPEAIDIAPAAVDIAPAAVDTAHAAVGGEAGGDAAGRKVTSDEGANDGNE